MVIGLVFVVAILLVAVEAETGAAAAAAVVIVEVGEISGDAVLLSVAVPVAV